MNDAHSFGSWLRWRRKELGLTQQEFADKVPCSVEMISRIESGRRKPSLQLAERLLEKLEIPSEERPGYVRWVRTGQPGPQPTTSSVAPAAVERPKPIPLLTNLPTPPTTLIGRAAEVRAAGAMLSRDDVRLVCMTGPGGVGKTRLALHVAMEALPTSPDGVWFVSLAPISDPGLVVSTVAQTLGVHEVAGQPLIECVGRYLHDKWMLLVLDNFEQVVGASTDVSQLLASSLNLKVLVTSRVGLHLRGEREFPVPPLSLPDTHRLPSLESLTQYEAVRLFIERARDVKPDFGVNDESAYTVAEICVRLDGLPLAIELAAVWIKTLPPIELLGRLKNRLALLRGGARDLPTRQQTLRNTIAWSYDLLDDAEQRLFRRMAVFMGGRMLDAMEAVCNSVGDPTTDVLDGVASLVDHSLLYQTEGPGGEPRYWMLETIHEYATEQLEESGEADEARRRHAHFFLEMAERAEPELRGPYQMKWLDRLEAEHDNMRTALGWMTKYGGEEGKGVALRLASSLPQFWQIRGYLTEGRSWLDTALASGRTEQPALRAKALNGAGRLAIEQGDFDTARAHFEDSLALYREAGDKVGIARLLDNLAIVASEQDDDDKALSLIEDCLALYREAGDKEGIVRSLNNMAIVVQKQGDDDRACALYEESLPVYREVGDKGGKANSLNNLGEIVQRQGSDDRARALYEESFALFRELGDKGGIANSLNNLGQLKLQQNDFEQAQAFFGESLTLIWELGNKQHSVYILEGLATVAGARRKADRAGRLFGATETLRETAGMPLSVAEHSARERHVASARAQLDEATWEAVWQEGRAMTWEQAIAYALEPVD